MADHKDLIERADTLLKSEVSKFEALNMVKELTGALEAAQEQCVEVKPLEWQNSGDYMVAKTNFGEFYAGWDDGAWASFEGDPHWEWSSDLDHRGLSEYDAQAACKAEYERRILASTTTRSVSDVWAEATAAAYGAAADIAHEGALATEDDGVAAWVRDRIKAQTTQSARDWLAERETEAYRKGQGDMQERAAKSCKNDDFAGDDKIGPGAWASALIRTLPIKEKDDE